MRMEAGAAAAWVDKCAHDEEVAIYVAEMLSFLAFACKVGETWEGKVVLYGGDNQVVREWITGRKSGTVVGRLMVRMLNLVEMRFRCVIIAAWWRTYHNTHADYITRCSDEEYAKLVKGKEWTVVDVTDALRQAVIDSERFGPCLLAWSEADRVELMQLKERRLRRSVPRALRFQWQDLHIVELAGKERLVTDLLDAAGNLGCDVRRAVWARPVHEGEIVMAAFPPHAHGKVARAATLATLDGKASLAVFEGPRTVPWEAIESEFEGAGWEISMDEFVTTEFGEAAARRRRCLVASPEFSVNQALVATSCRGMLAPPCRACLGPTRLVPEDHWIEPEKLVLDNGIPRDPLLPILKGHYWRGGVRHNLVGTSGPILWPLKEAETVGVQDRVVWDQRGPATKLRLLTAEEVWKCQGRDAEFQGLIDQGYGVDRILEEGNKATGSHTAMALVLMAGYLSTREGKGAGGGVDGFGDENTTKLLRWLLRWKRGLLPRAEPERRAGGHEGAEDGPDTKARVVWRWGESLWLDVFNSDDEEEDGGTYRAGRRPSRRGAACKAVGEAVIDFLPSGVAPFDGEVGHLVEDWVDENLTGYHAASTTKQYAGIYGKWKAWAARQGWPSDFLDKAMAVEANEDKLLGFLGYLGWLGCTVATLKQAIFAVKDAHKKFGHGDPTERMHRLWLLITALEKRSVKKLRRLGVTPEMLKWIGLHLFPNEEASGGDFFDAVMLWCALNVAWFFMLRAKEYCDSNGVDFEMILRGADLKFVTSGDGEDLIIGVTLQFRKTKTDQEAFGGCKTMYRSGVKGLCVVEALVKLRQLAPQRFGQGSEALRPLFRWAGGQVLKRTQVQNILQKAAVACGLPKERFMSHSLRIGGASALFQATGEIEVVKRTGRWSSSAVQRYLHDGEVALKDVAMKMANVDQKVHYT